MTAIGAREMHSSADVRMADVAIGRWRRRLQSVAIVRGLLAGAGSGGLAFALIRLLTGASEAPSVANGATAELGVDRVISPVALSVALIAGLSVAAVVWWRAGGAALSAQRAALWLEEQAPALRFSLVSSTDSHLAPNVRGALERVVRSVPWEVPARAALWRSLRIPSAAAAVGIAAAVLLPQIEGTVRTFDSRAAGGAGAGKATALGTVTVTVRPPRYTGRPAERVLDPSLVRAYPGSEIAIAGRGDAASVIATVDSARLAVGSTAHGWSATFATGASRALMRVARERGDSRLIALEPVIDSAPIVTLRAPARDTVLRTPRGTIALAADVEDDIGIASATFEYIISSGEGERFTFKSGTLGALPNGTRTHGVLRTSLSLEGLGLVGGDVVHLRGVARDRNAVSGPGVGSSESRTIRIARVDEYDSVAVDQAPPPEVDKSILSQRMLINLTEALVKRARTISRADVTSESRKIGRDQARLRKQVSDIIFARLGDAAEGAGEHFHGDGHNHAEAEQLAAGPLTPEQLLKAAERATEINGSPTDFEHDETPVVAINRPMLEAYNAMWDAGRSLEVGEPAKAIPPMYIALAAIQRARAAERLYLRGAPPRVVVDLARVRLQGKDKGTPSARTARASLDASRSLLLARFGRALDALERGGASGIDSLIVLRLAVADRLPGAASALEAAIGALRASRDATESLVLVRRALDGALVARDSLASWGAIR